MFTLSPNKKNTVLTLFILIFLGFFVNTTFVHASSDGPVLVLTVETLDGEVVKNVVNGKPVILRWYIDGPVTNCTVTDVGPIDTSVLPVNGSKEIIPATDGKVSYELLCDEKKVETLLNLEKPSVNLTIEEGTTLMNNSLTGRVNSVDVRWTSTNTTKCGLLWRESASTPGVKIYETNSGYYWDQYKPSGRVLYNGSYREINESTTFYITCTNENTGEDATSSISLVVTNPAPPLAPIVVLSSPDYPTVYRDELYGYAYVDVNFSSANVTNCVQKAYYANGDTYPNPPGWGTGSNIFAKNFTNIKLSTTTEFEVTCSRGPVTIAGTLYPEVFDTKRILISVEMPLGVTEPLDTWDRSGLAPVVAEVSADPSSIVKNAVSGLARTEATIHAENADRCYLKSFYTNDTPTDFSDDTEFVLTGWSGEKSGNIDWSNPVYLSKQTRLSITCQRDWDVASGIANGAASDDLIVYVNDPVVAAPDPVVHLYSNVVSIDADSIWTSAIERDGFNYLRHGSPDYIESYYGTVAAYGNKISFPFVHPKGGSEKYDIYLQMCDENDGESVFRLYTEDNGMLDVYTTNSVDSTGNICGTSYGTVINILFAKDVMVDDGDIITVECDTPSDGESCRFSKVWFGNGIGGDVVTSKVDPVVKTADITTAWVSENTSRCYDYKARQIYNKGYTYNWYSGPQTSGVENEVLSTTTRFSIACIRDADGVTISSNFLARVPYLTKLSASADLSVGECIDKNTDTTIKAPHGYVPDSNGYCIPALNLLAGSPSISNAERVEDNVNGTYDNILALITIDNEGKGSLPPGDKISYKGSMTFMPVFKLPVLDTAIGFYDAGLDAPIDRTKPVRSGTLTRVFDGVPFGTHSVCSRVNLDGSPNYPESSSDFSDNTSCTSVTLPVPEPPMLLSVDREIIRSGQSISIDWSINVTYQMICTVKGPGGLDVSFNTLNHSNPYNGSYTTSPLTSASTYEFSCTETITDTTFTKAITVEMVPEVQET